MNSVTERFLSRCNLDRNLAIVQPCMLLVENVIFCETTVRVNASKEHSFADVSVTGPALETLAAENVGLAGDNVAFAKIGDFLAYFDDLSRKLVSHDHRRLDFVSDRFVPVVDVHVRSTDRCGFDPYENVSQARLRCWPLFEDGAGTRRCLYNCVHLFFQRISSKLVVSRAGSAVKRFRLGTNSRS